MKIFNVELSDTLHAKIKAAAALQHKAMNLWIVEVLAEAVKEGAK
jgi:predicted HicB family RNase H-like nuclease